MKRLLLILALLLMAGSVQGLSIDFQNPSDFSAQVGLYQSLTCPAGGSYVQSATGGNSYVSVVTSTPGCVCGQRGYLRSQTPLVMTYAAGTHITGSGAWGNQGPYIIFGDSVGTITSQSAVLGVLPAYSRVEIFMIGGDAHIFVNGVDTVTDPGISPNPYYIGFGPDYSINACSSDGTASWDDIIWGSSQPLLDTAPDKYILGMPETGYFLMKDILNPAASGFYRSNGTGLPVLIASNSFTSTFGKGNGNNESITLSSPTGGVVQTQYSGTAYAGTITWNLTDFFNSGANYGLYQTDMTNAFLPSDYIPYIGNGASIAFDKVSYAVGEDAVITVVVSDSYYDLATYSYHVVIQDVWGTVISDQPITFSASPHTGTVSYTWLSTNAEGAYYGIIYAHRLSDHTDLMMNYDVADLSSNLIVNGFVKSAETTSGISGATVNITQGITTDSVSSGVDGNYTSSSTFSANIPTTIVAGKSGYESYSHTFTPLMAGSISINLTLMPTTPTFSGVALGGIARTPPYNRTIDSATITITNANATYTATTNSAGYYIKNYMLPNQWWNIVGAKTGFANSSTYSKLVVGI